MCLCTSPLTTNPPMESMNSWEKFEKEFRSEYTKRSDPTGMGIMTMWQSSKDPEDAIKFIRQTLQAQKDQLRREIEGMKVSNKGQLPVGTHTEVGAYNAALEALIEKL